MFIKSVHEGNAREENFTCVYFSRISSMLRLMPYLTYLVKQRIEMVECLEANHRVFRS